MQIKHCVVTGASGFIGRVLCRELQKQNVKVRALLRRISEGPWDEGIVQELNNVEITPLSPLLTKEADTIFHLAGITHTNVHSALPADVYFKINVQASEALMRLAVNTGVRRFIYFSSVKAIDPTDDYGHSKKLAEECILDLGQKHNIHTAILRPALVYGPYLKGNLLNMLRGIDRSFFPPLPDIHNQRSLISVEDVVAAALMVAENPKANGKVYTITDNRIYSTRQLYDAMRKELGLSPLHWAFPHSLLQSFAKIGDMIQRFFYRKFPFTSDTLEKLLGSTYYSSQLIQEELGWVPKQDFFTVLPAIIKAYKSF